MEDIAIIYMKESLLEFLSFVKQLGNRINDNWLRYLEDVLDEYNRILIFYYLLKVHKKKVLILLYLVVSIINTTLNALEK